MTTQDIFIVEDSALVRERLLELLGEVPESRVVGVAAGAGCSLALACDMRIASDQASFIEVFVNVGLIPDSGSTFMLPRLVGLGKAMELCCTGQKVDAAEALRLGLVNQVVEPGQAQSAALALCERLNALPLHALAAHKELLNQALPWPQERGEAPQ